MPSKVHFASAKVKKLSADDTLPAKFMRLLDRFDLKEMFGEKRVAVKMHVGGHLGYTTIHPLFIRMFVSKLKEAGAEPFITDGSFSVAGAKARGYTEEVLGAPVYPVAGVADRHFVTKEVGYRTLDSINVAGDIAGADAMVVLSHAKGHGNCGFGGAIKNIAMGCVTTETRGWIHALSDTAFTWNSEACRHCYLCRDNCPGGAVSFNDKGEFSIFQHNCRYCMHCVTACPEHAITIDDQGVRYFQEGMARVTKVVLDCFERNRVLYLTLLLNVTPLCDCWGFSTPAIVPDVGIMAAKDIVAIEQAAIDAIKFENYIPGSLPEQVQMDERDGHLLWKIWRKDPYLQVATAAEIGLGSREYELAEVA